MTKLVYVHQYFKTPVSAGGLRSFYLSEYLANEYDEIVIITSTLFKNDADSTYLNDRVRIKYVNVDYRNNWSFFTKTWSFIKFGLKAFFEVAVERDVSTLYITSTPLFVGLTGLLAKYFRGWNYIFEVRDVWPQVAIEAGVLKNSILIYLLEGFEKRIYKESAGIVCLSPGMTDLVASKVDSEVPLCTAYNMSDFKSPVKEAPADGIIRLIYFGSLNLSNGYEDLIGIIDTVKNRVDFTIDIFLHEGGLYFKKIQDYLLENGIRNTQIQTALPWRDLRNQMWKYDYSLVLFDRKNSILGTNSPNKMFDSLSCGVPIVVNTDGWMKSAVEEFKFGRYLSEANDILELVSVKSDVSREQVFHTAKKLYSKQVTCEIIKKFINENITSNK